MGKTRKDQRSRVVENAGLNAKPHRERSPRTNINRRLQQIDVTDDEEVDDMLDELPAFEKF